MTNDHDGRVYRNVFTRKSVVVPDTTFDEISIDLNGQIIYYVNKDGVFDVIEIETGKELISDY